tara:strand:+ start:299 stop:1102 length:804 start_codon:yes stop_codon:yes gene_type:complete
MKIGFLITARLKSSRLKMKLLKPLNGYTVIERVIQRAKKVKDCSDIVLCTSGLNQDLPLVKTAIENKIYYYNGNAEDVLQRLLDACKLFNMDYFIGITADNPLFSIHHANVISDMIKFDSSIDFIYTTGMPIGVNIYGIKIKALETVCSIKQEIDTEIWGYLINRPEIFNVKEIKVEKKYEFEKSRITLDEIDDYNFFKEIYKNFPKNEIIDILDAYKFLRANPKIKSMNKDVVQRDLSYKIKNRISKFYQKNKDQILDIKRHIYLS